MPPGLYGISNSGNTCYINSVLQCLSNIPVCKYVFLSQDIQIHPRCKTGGQLVKAMCEFMKEMWSTNNAVLTTRNIRSALGAHTIKFTSSQQQDAQEFLLYLLAALNEETKIAPDQFTNSNFHSQQGAGSQRALHFWHKFQSRESSVFSDIFVGQLRSSVRCASCKKTSVIYEIFWDLPLPVTSGDGSLYDCLDKFFEGETMHNTCQFCKRHSSLLKRFEIQRLPPVLILWFKRFSSDFTEKITSRISFPRNELNMADYISASGNIAEGSRTSYDLYAISNHKGNSALYGHYTAYCRKEGTDKWNEYDDTQVRPVQAHTLSSSDAEHIAYLLMYQRC